MTQYKEIFDKTEISEVISKNSESFVNYLRKTIPGIYDITYTCGISLTRFEIVFPQGYNIARFTGTNAKKSYLSRFNSFFNTNFSNLYQDGDKLIVEIPNRDRGILHFDRAIKALSNIPKEEGKIHFYIGESIDGTPLIGNIEEYPHILIAGASGSGKSVNMQSILVSLLTRYNEREINLYLFDTKRVEFSLYKEQNIKQIKGHVTEPELVYKKLSELQKEMNARYDIMEEKGFRKLSDYNLHNPNTKLPYIIIVFDEYADMITSSGNKDVENIVQNIAQKARACGMYIILCTQRPDAKTVDTRTREQIGGRICFKVDTSRTSNMVIKTSGAEKLQNRGDGYFLSEGIPVRFQGAMLEDYEIKAAIKEIAQNQ